MRRTIIAITALAVMVAAGVAYAATLNTYTSSVSVSPSAPGTAAKPSAAGFTLKLGAKPVNSSLNAAPLTDIKTTIYGLKSNYKDFPTCTYKAILKAAADTGCKPGALVASGTVTAILGEKNLTMPYSFPCNPRLDVWNGGGGQLVFFFVTTGQPGSAYYCNGVATGDTPPYVGTIKQSGKNLIQDTPLPPTVSTNVVGAYYGSLVLENLTYKKLTTKVKGKKVAFFESVGCKSGKRPYSVEFTATNGTISESVTNSGSAKCS